MKNSVDAIHNPQREQKLPNHVESVFFSIFNLTLKIEYRLCNLLSTKISLNFTHQVSAKHKNRNTQDKSKTIFKKSFIKIGM